MNLLPGIDEDTVRPRATGWPVRVLRQPRATGDDGDGDARRSRTAAIREGMTVGLMHPTGAKAVARLAEAGVALPEGWVVRQDHVRRGLVARTPVDADEAEVVEWCVRAGTALCRAEMTGRWRAVVYLP